MTDTEISRYMALLLRHKPEIAGLVLDKQGWADVDMLLKCISENMEPVSFERLCEIVKNDSKQRYSSKMPRSARPRRWPPPPSASRCSTSCRS